MKTVNKVQIVVLYGHGSDNRIAFRYGSKGGDECKFMSGDWIASDGTTRNDVDEFVQELKQADYIICVSCNCGSTAITDNLAAKLSQAANGKIKGVIASDGSAYAKPDYYWTGTNKVNKTNTWSSAPETGYLLYVNGTAKEKAVAKPGKKMTIEGLCKAADKMLKK